MKILTKKQQTRLEREHRHLGYEAGRGTRRVYVTACTYTHARLAALEANQADATVATRPEQLQGLNGGILLIGHKPNWDLVGLAKLRGMTIIRIPT